MAFRFIDEEEQPEQRPTDATAESPRRTFTFIDEEPEDAGPIDRTLDLGIDLGKGVVRLGQGAVGLVDMATGGYAGQGMRALGYDPEGTMEAMSEWYSPERQAEEREFASAQGVGGKVGTLLSEPGLLFGRVAESAPQMLGSAAVARKVFANVLARTGDRAAAMRAATLAASGTEGAQQAGTSFEEMTADGIPVSDAYVPAIGSGLTTAAIGYGVGRLGTRMGLGDVDAGIAGSGGAPIRALKGMTQEGIEEAPQSGAEQMWSNYGYDRPLMQGVPESAAVGGLVGAFAGGGMSALARPNQPYDLLQGEPDNQPTEEAQGPPLLLTRQNDPMVVFPDGTVARQSETEAMLMEMEDEGRFEEAMALRTKLFGLRQHEPKEQTRPLPEIRGGLTSQEDMLRDIHRQRVAKDYALAEEKRRREEMNQAYQDQAEKALQFRIKEDIGAAEQPTAMELAMRKAIPSSLPWESAIPKSQPKQKPDDALSKSGKPFKTRQAAQVWLKQNPEYLGYEPANIGVGQWVARKTEQKSAPKAEQAPRTDSPPITQENPYADVPRGAINTPYSGPERRADISKRKKISEMSEDEMRAELHTSDVTGIKNRRAYEDTDRKPVQVSIDADALKWVNDNMGPEAGDQLLREIAKTIKETTQNGYHLSGDEFMIEADSAEEAASIMDKVNSRLRKATIAITRPDGKKYIKQGLEVTHATSSTKEAADYALKQAKAERERQGLRPARGEQPPGVVIEPPQGQQDREDHGAAEVSQDARDTGEEPKNEKALQANEGRDAVQARQKEEVAKQAKEAPVSLPKQETKVKETDLDSKYDESLKVWRAASKKFTAATLDYRAKKINDAEYIEARKAFDLAQEVADKAETEFIDAKNKEANESLSKKKTKTTKPVVKESLTTKPTANEKLIPKKLAVTPEKPSIDQVIEDATSKPTETAYISYLKGRLQGDFKKNEAKIKDAWKKKQESKIADKTQKSSVVSSKTPIKASSKESVTEAIRQSGRAAKKALEAGKIKVVQSEAELPKGSRPPRADEKTSAIYRGSDDTIHIVADNVSPSRVNSVLLHEAFHARAKEHLGPQYDRLMSRLDTIDKIGKQGGKIGEFFKKGQASIPEDVPKEHYLEELASYTLQRYQEAPRSLPETILKWVRDFIAAIRTSIVRLGYLPKNITEADLASIARSSLRRFAKDSDGKRDVTLESKEKVDKEVDKKTGEVDKEDGFTLPKETRGQKARRKIQDEALRFQVIQDAVVKQGGTVNEQTDVAKAIKNYPGRLAARIHDLTKKTVEPLLKQMVKDGITMDDVGLYKYAVHAPERNAAIAKINKNFPNTGKKGKSGSGMTDKEANDIRKEIEASPQFKAIKKASDALDKIISDRLDGLVKEGVMSKDQADAYRTKYKNYVPLKGFEEADESGTTTPGTGRGFSTGKKIDFRALGRESRAADIFQNIIRDAEMAMMLGEKNNVGRILRHFVEANPDGKLWTVEKIPKEPQFTKGQSKHLVYYYGSMVAEFANLNDARAYAKELRGKAGVKETDVEVKSQPLHPEGLVVLKDAQFDPEGEVRFIEGSDTIRIQLHDPLMARAYNRLWNNGVSDGLKLLNTYNALLRQTYTQKNPAWFLLNALRDVQQVVPYLTGEKGLKFATKAVGNTPWALKTSWDFYHQKKLKTADEKMVERFRHAGGSVGFAYVGDIEAKTTELDGILHRYTSWRETLKTLKRGEIKKGAYDVLVKTLNSKGFAWIEALNTSFENMSRLATFKAAVEEGMSNADAAKLAKHVTVNFNTRGEWGPNINAVWLFANANIQGSRNLGHALLYSKHKKQVWALAGGLFSLGMMAGLMGDDDDDLVSGSDRGRFLVFKIGDKVIKWPMPYGWGAFGGLGQLFAQALKHPESHDQMAIEMADLTMQHFSPIGNPFAGGTNDMAGVVNLLPTAPKPFAQAAFNRSSFGGPLYPNYPYDDTVPDSEKAWRTTKGSGYDRLAKWLNDISGGDAAQEGGISVSPESIKLGVSTVGGGVGRLITDLVSLPVNLASGDTTAKDYPLVKSVFGQITEDEYMRRFHEQAKKAKEAYRIFKNYQSKSRDSAGAYFAENQLIISLGKMSEKYGDYLRRLREQEDQVKLDESMSEVRRRLELERLDAERKRIAVEFNRRVKDINQ